MKRLMFFFLLFLLSCNRFVFAQSPLLQETMEAKILRIQSEKTIQVMGKNRTVQEVQVQFTRGSLKGKIITIDTGAVDIAHTSTYKKNDEVVVLYTQGSKGEDVFFISDYVRRFPLYMLFALFVIISMAIAGWHGLRSLLGMICSFGVIFLFIIPQILQGVDPVFTAVLGSLFLIPITFFISHGINKKTMISVVGTLIALVITGMLAKFFVVFSHLTGFAAEEASFIQTLPQGSSINMQGLLLAGIIIGVSGILDDITISQSAVIEKLQSSQKEYSFSELYKHGMDVGRDHIASLINTLVLVYTGAALPLMVLFVNNPHPFSEVINYEIIATEIVRTLVGSIGLILAVPLTTILAAFVYKKNS